MASCCRPFSQPTRNSEKQTGGCEINGRGRIAARPGYLTHSQVSKYHEVGRGGKDRQEGQMDGEKLRGSGGASTPASLSLTKRRGSRKRLKPSLIRIDYRIPLVQDERPRRQHPHTAYAEWTGSCGNTE